MPDREDPDFVPPHEKSVKGNEARGAVGNYEFADVTVYPPSEQRVRTQAVDCGANGSRGGGGSLGIVPGQ